jgi:iron(III) transport system ATP-binding protein
MDEPFSNLDTELRETLGYEVRGLLKELGMTAIMVTHDQYDAFALGDQIGVMSQGKLLQWDSSFNLYHAPNSRFVANVMGDGVFINGRMVAKKTVKTIYG